jgi:hypothetical protein
MRTPDELEAVAVEAYGPYAAVCVTEVRSVTDAVRWLRRRLHTLAERSECGRTVRFAQRTLARDAVGAECAVATDTRGERVRPLAWIEHALNGAGGERAAVTPSELRALVAEWRRLRRALVVAARESRCARSRDYAARALATGRSSSRKAASPTLRAAAGE